MRTALLTRTAARAAAFCTVLSKACGLIGAVAAPARSRPPHLRGPSSFLPTTASFLTTMSSSSSSHDDHNGDAPPSSSDPPLSQRLWSRYEPLGVCALHHPFVRGLGSGRLCPTAFKGYVAQDAFFLRSFAQAYQLAADRAATDQATVQSLTSLISAVSDELRLHSSLSASLGIDLDSTQPSPACSAYTSFLLRLASRPSSSVALIMAAMAPCMRLYAFLGQALRRAYPQPAEDNRYEAWVSTYSSPDFEAAARLVEQLLDQHHAHRRRGGSKEEEEEAELWWAYGRAMELELGFFHEAYGRPHEGRRPRLLVVDFDGTCTEEDTTPLLAKAAEQYSPSPSSTQASWSSLTDHYLQGFQRALTAATSAPRPPVGAEVLLDAFSALDEESLRLVAESKVLAGIPRGALPELLLQGPLRPLWRLRPHCLLALQLAQSMGPSPPHYLSVSWSDEIIRTAMQAPAEQVTANRLVYDDETGTSTGEVQVQVRGARGKLEHWHRLVASSDGHGGPTVFVGDSLTDLLALSAADLGLVIGRSSSLEALAHALGLRIRPLLLAQDEEEEEKGDGGKGQRVLYRAESWVEVAVHLYGAIETAKALHLVPPTPPALQHDMMEGEP